MRIIARRRSRVRGAYGGIGESFPVVVEVGEKAALVAIVECDPAREERFGALRRDARGPIERGFGAGGIAAKELDAFVVVRGPVVLIGVRGKVGALGRPLPLRVRDDRAGERECDERAQLRKQARPPVTVALQCKRHERPHRLGLDAWGQAAGK